jgi:Rieske Fe-S protein
VDEQGQRHECSAVCPHLAGVVHWNSAERSWDCPCHGSRFAPHGHVVAGPARRGLTQLEDQPRDTAPVVSIRPGTAAE